MMSSFEGKLRVLLAFLVLDIFAFILLFISFVTPYWIISWPRVYSGFRKMGLWEVCFAGMLLEYDPAQKAYYGCWWILAPELYEIRSFIMPPWFIVIQILVTICLMLEIILVILDAALWVASLQRDNSGIGRKRAPYSMVQSVTWITVATCVMKVSSVLIFGLAYKFDPFWLPQHEINYPHFSYGLLIVSAFFSIFSSVAHRVHRSIVKTDDYINPATGARGYFVAGTQKV
ncbi:hypothetical protein HELRODRAFT_194101 [Helobdella robusta]|uniref:Uncharacterized protein n=1 Tax=Helobdella robusta TaxID=6412 RepID=T1FVN9_HELRO|nr:hypothetical protein HELRODRAFT_194101 [Helobdella robusta]ESN93455.1 hypothetical protein HELRODRAFT_194101 [Helobdella robusta]